MMQEKQRIARRIRRVPCRAQDAADAKVARAVNVGLRERRDALELARKRRVVWLREDAGDEPGVGERVHDGGDEVAAQAVGRREVERELVRSKGPSLDAAAARAARDVQWVLLGRGRHQGPVAAEAIVGVEHGGVKGSGRGGVLGLGVERPVPVAVVLSMSGREGWVVEGDLRLTASVAALIPQCLLVRSDEVTVPEGEVTDPVDRRRLIVVHSDMIVVPMHRPRDPRFGVLLGQTDDGVQVRFLLRLRKLTPSKACC
jgi:hypothetical protein